MLTLLLIIHNNECQLKQTLSNNISYLARKNILDVIILDNASTDNTQEYIYTHFPKVRYFKNEYEQPFGQNLEKICTKINSDYILLIDVATQIDYLNIVESIDEFKKKSLFGIIYPVSNPSNSEKKITTIHYKKSKFFFKKVNSTHKEKVNLAFSSCMLFDTKKLQTLHIQSLYDTEQFTLTDLILRAKKQNWNLITGTLVSKQIAPLNLIPNSPHIEEQFRDEWLFHLFSISSKRLAAKWLLSFFSTLLGFKPRRLKQWLVQPFFLCFIKNTVKKQHWTAINDFQILTKS